MNFERTYRIDRLFHKFLKSKGVSAQHLGYLSYLLESFGFIRVSPDKERYIETEKLTSGKNRETLFKIIEKVAQDAKTKESDYV